MDRLGGHLIVITYFRLYLHAAGDDLAVAAAPVGQAVAVPSPMGKRLSFGPLKALGILAKRVEFGAASYFWKKGYGFRVSRQGRGNGWQFDSRSASSGSLSCSLIFKAWGSALNLAEKHWPG
jgi:hypothetical protein